MKIVITGGGTGGHFFPAYTIAKRLLNEKHDVFYFGNKECIEYEYINKDEIPFYDIPSKSTIHKDVSFFLQNSKGVLKSLSFLKKIKPHVIYSTGGYTTAPTIAAAKMLKIPYVLHEQNTVVGLVNRIFRNGAEQFIHSFPFEHKEKEKVIGNISRYTQPSNREEKYIVFIGGSGGASKINELAVNYAKENPKRQIILLSGRNYIVNNVLDNLKVYPFVENMSEIFSKTDIAVARAGSTTLVELSSLGIPSIIIPMPNSADDHQAKNAEYFEWKNAIIKINEDEYVFETLRNTINKMNKKEKKQLSKNFHRCYNFDAENQIIQVITSVN